MNLRDSGCDVIIGNRRDRYRKTAVEDGFDVSPISEVVPRADILIIAIPDEIQQQVYEKHIRDHLLPGQVMDFASSYGIRFECIVPPDDIDVVMMSPRAMGVTVREAYEADKGVPGFVAVWQDVSGKARKIALALAKLEHHYFVHRCFFEEDQLIKNVSRISHAPVVIVQGRYDMVCPLTTAADLSKAWRRAQFKVVANAGHSASEEGISAALVSATNAFRDGGVV